MGQFADFPRNGIFEETLNATSISLLPKVAGVDNIKKFRPNGLVEVFIKFQIKSSPQDLVEVGMLSSWAIKFWMHH